MIALAERFGLKNGFQPTMSAARARRAAQDADRPTPRPRRRTRAWTRKACAPPPAPPCGNGPRSAVEVPPDLDPRPQVPGHREVLWLLSCRRARDR